MGLTDSTIIKSYCFGRRLTVWIAEDFHKPPRLCEISTLGFLLDMFQTELPVITPAPSRLTAHTSVKPASLNVIFIVVRGSSSFQMFKS